MKPSVTDITARQVMCWVASNFPIVLQQWLKGFDLEVASVNEKMLTTEVSIDYDPILDLWVLKTKTFIDKKKEKAA